MWYNENGGHIMLLEQIAFLNEKQIKSLHTLGIDHLQELLEYYPYRYDIMKKTPLIHDEKVIVDGIISSSLNVSYLNRKRRIQFTIHTGSQLVNVWVYNRIFLLKILKIGADVIIIGKYNKWKNVIVASEVKKGKLLKEEIISVYHGKGSLKSNEISNIIKEGFLIKEWDIIDYIPKDLVEKYHFLDKKSALKQIHFPSNFELLKMARLRLKYEELLIYLLKIRYMKESLKKTERAISRGDYRKEINSFVSLLPFKLTKDQLISMKEIIGDMVVPKRMNRLLQGDVGSGKTIVSFVASYYNYLSGYQTAYMAPTEILAKQHYENASSLFKDIPMKISLLTSSVKGKERSKIYEELEEGKIDFVIGTQSLVQEKLKFHKLGLVVTDEQHRFGVNQRSSLKNKGDYPDVLSMSATPIPRTYALTIYGDMDISSIKTKPTGRKEVITAIFDEKEITKVLQMMYNELQKNHQIYVIAPLIEENEGNDRIENVTKLEEKMNRAFGKKYKIASLHGNMKNQEKEKIMNDFSSNKINILISTTVIEVGVDVKNASMIVIFDANNFGLSTIHQLRGRVGRSNIQSYCLLITKKKTDRLDILKKTNDGFEISEFDFQNRGYGDLFGVKQSGEMHFKIADIKKDYKILVQAKKDAEVLINQYFKGNLANKKIYDCLFNSDNLD